MDSNPFVRDGVNDSPGSQLNQKDPLTPPEESGPGPERLIRLLVRLGPTFIKIGQFLALRPDILPEAYCDELLRLVDRAPSAPWEVIREIIQIELGAEPGDLFKKISRQPLAAGSIAQVHVAQTWEGEEIAVKVQRPNLPAQIKRDLRKIRWLAGFLKVSGIAPFISPAELVQELERWLKQELDFTRELSNHTRMFDELAGEKEVRIPRPYPEFSSPRVISTEYLKGLPFSDLIRYARRGEFEQIERLGLDRDLLAERLIRSSLTQIFQQRFFHADMHPGNLIAMGDNVIGLIDFGLTDVLDPTVQEVQSDYLGALYNNDIHGMYRAISQIFVPGKTTDQEAFRRDFYSETSRWLSTLEDRSDNGHRRSPTASYMITLMQLARAHEMRPPTSVLSMYRTLLTSESVAYHLRTEANLRDVGRQFFNNLQVERLISSYYPVPVMSRLMELNELVRSGPGNAHQILSDLSEGRFVLSVQSTESEQTRGYANKRARLLALAIFSMTLALLLTFTAGRQGRWQSISDAILWLLLFGVFGWMAILWRRLR
jgi:ubiquinone biosynthesis protein